MTAGTVEGILEVVRQAAREGRLTKVGHWRNMRIHLDGEQADTLVEFATCTLYMRGELYGHVTPDGTYLRIDACTCTASSVEETMIVLPSEYTQGR